MIWLFVIAGVLLLGYTLHRLALAAERRGWIYYKNKHASAGLGTSLIGQIYQPSIEHVVEEQQSRRIAADRNDSGDDDGDDTGPGTTG